VLALGAFVVAADGTLVVGLLRPIARSLAVSPATAGQALTVFGAVYAVGAPLVVRAARRVRPEQLAAGALAVFAAANAATAAAPSYAALLGARALSAACAGVFMPTAALVAARAVSEERRGRALAVVVAGSSAATALGVPLGTFVGGAVGWRTVFYAVAIAAAAIAAAATSLPRTEPPPPAPARGGVLLPLATTLVWATGSFTFFTYVAVVLARRASVGTAGLAAFLLLFGLVGIAGAAAAGRLTDTRGPRPALVGALLLVAVALAGLVAATGRVAVAALVALYALGTWAVTPPQQHRLLAAGGDTGFLLSLNASALYAGVALGSALGGAILALTGSVAALCGVAAGLELLAVASIWSGLWLSHARIEAHPRSSRSQPRGVDSTRPGSRRR
jgi:MFS transporter, DHA1 family, inner membrane transport protein